MLHKPFTNPFDASFIELPSTDSTNNYALKAIRQGNAQHGTAFFAWEQTNGKGQMGRKWQSEKGNNIALSIVLAPFSIPVSAQFQLSACVAVAAEQFVYDYATGGTSIKWPNDLYWRDKKLGGILIESIIGNREPEPGNPDKNAPVWKWAVAGIGINVNQVAFPPDLPNPVSLKQITGKDFSTLELARGLHARIIQSFSTMLNEGFDPFFSRYNNKLYKLNEQVRLKKGSKSFQTNIKGVSASGQLVTGQNNIEERFEFGEVQWMIS